MPGYWNPMNLTPDELTRGDERKAQRDAEEGAREFDARREYVAADEDEDRDIGF